MNSETTGDGKLFSALHRTILGVMLAVVFMIGMGWAIRSPMTQILGVAGLLLAFGSGISIIYLIIEGIREE